MIKVFQKVLCYFRDHIVWDPLWTICETQSKYHRHTRFYLSRRILLGSRELGIRTSGNLVRVQVCRETFPQVPSRTMERIVHRQAQNFPSRLLKGFQWLLLLPSKVPSVRHCPHARPASVSQSSKGRHRSDTGLPSALISIWD